MAADVCLNGIEIAGDEVRAGEVSRDGALAWPPLSMPLLISAQESG